MTVTIPFIANIADYEVKAWQTAFSEALPSVSLVPTAMLEKKQGHSVAVVANPDPSEIASLLDLVWVQSLWAGVEKIINEPTLKNIGIARLIDPQLASTMAEAVLAWTLYLHRDMPRYRTLQQQKKWCPLPYIPPQDRKVGILGLGKLGIAAAQKLLSNNFTVLGWSRSEKRLDGVQSFYGETGLREMVSQCDIIVCLLPLTKATEGLINSKLLALLPTGASLINFGRGPILDTSALITSLDAKRLNHAVLDVFDQEPLPVNNPLWAHKSVTVLPHISAPTTIATGAKVAADNIKRYLKDGTLPQLADRKQGY